MSRQSRDVLVATLVATFMVGAVYVLMAGAPRSGPTHDSGVQAMTAGDAPLRAASPRQAYELASDRYAAYRDLMTVDGPQRGEALYYAARTAMDCTAVLRTLDAPPASEGPVEPARDVRRQAALSELKTRCAGFGRHIVKFLDLRAQAAAAGFAPAIADELPLQYRGGVISADEAWQRAQRLAQSDDPRVYEGLGAYVRLAGIDLENAAEDRLATHELAWRFVVCRSGAADCGPSGYWSKFVCALDGVCDALGLEAAASTGATPQHVDLANRYAGEITKALHDHDLVALGLDHPRPYVPPKE